MITVACLFRVTYYVILSVGLGVLLYGLAGILWVAYIMGSSLL